MFIQTKLIKISIKSLVCFCVATALVACSDKAEISQVGDAQISINVTVFSYIIINLGIINLTNLGIITAGNQRRCNTKKDQRFNRNFN